MKDVFLVLMGAFFILIGSVAVCAPDPAPAVAKTKYVFVFPKDAPSWVLESGEFHKLDENARHELLQRLRDHCKANNLVEELEKINGQKEAEKET